MVHLISKDKQDELKEINVPKTEQILGSNNAIKYAVSRCKRLTFSDTFESHEVQKCCKMSKAPINYRVNPNCSIHTKRLKVRKLFPNL